jgi:Type II secretion system (T2SS), protein N
MKRKAIILLVSCTVFVGAIAYCPVSLLRTTVNEQLAGVARIENMEGTIWHGDALLVFDSKQLRQTPIKWRFTPSLLASGIFAYSFELNKNSQQNNEIFGELTVGRGLSDLHVRNAHLYAPAASVLPLLSPSLGFGAFSGQLGFTTESMAVKPSPTLTAAKITGRANLNWRNANSLFLLGSTANDYLLEFDGKGAESTFSLKTLSGPVAANGQGTWVLEKTPPYNAIKFNGAAKLPQALLSRLGNASTWLTQLGRMEGDQLLINWNGRL